MTPGADKDGRDGEINCYQNMGSSPVSHLARMVFRVRVRPFSRSRQVRKLTMDCRRPLLYGRGKEAFNLRISLVIMLLRSEPSRDHLVFDGVRQSKIVVAICGHISVFNQLIVKVSVNSFLYAADSSLFCDFGNTNSPAVFRICCP